jgi:hypothetical protein
MKNLILILYFGLLSCMNTKFLDDLSIKKIDISLEVNGCINKDSNTVSFIIHNKNDFGFWIHGWHLVLDSITTKNGLSILPNSLIESRAPNIPEYSWVNPMSQLRITFSTSFFKRFTLKSDEFYYLYTSYDKYTTRKRHSEQITLLGPINIKRIIFMTCP